MSTPNLTDAQGTMLLALLRGVADSDEVTSDETVHELAALGYVELDQRSTDIPEVTDEGREALREWVGPDEAHNLVMAGVLEAAS